MCLRNYKKVKKCNWAVFAFAASFFSASLLASCAVLSKGGVDSAVLKPETPPAVVPSGLQSASFKRLPADVYTYLEEIYAAFQRKDADFLYAQGEASFTEWAKSNVDGGGELLARLFRAGAYSGESGGSVPAAAPSIDLARIQGITYIDWEENGPFIAVRAALTANDEKIPALLLILWKLDVIKLQGIIGG